MARSTTNHRTGQLITGFGGLALSLDIPLVRLANGDSWSILLLRCAATLAVALIVWSVWRFRSGKAPALIPGWAGLAVASLYGLCSIFFIVAVHETSTANLVFILAFTSMFAAILSWLFLGERPSRATLLTMAAMLVGILIIVGDGLGTGGMLGDLMALAAAFAIAGAITISRASGRDMGLASLVGVALPLVTAAIVLVVSGDAPTVASPGWIILDGAIVIPAAFYCLALGPRYLSGPEVALFYLLETVLAPVWVWWIFTETPSRGSLVGGTILVAALTAHSIWQLARTRRLDHRLH
jgi:drug/metabolite transporter (DMT)-like permease